MYNLLTTGQKPLNLELNGVEFNFKTQQTINQSTTAALNSDKWHDVCVKSGLKDVHASSVSTILQLVEREMDFTKLSEDKIKEVYKEETLFFEDAVERESIYKLNATRIAAVQEFSLLEERKAQIDRKELAKNMRYFQLASVWFTFQFGISYYAIFEVEWLGWDLVEPFTYSVSQATAIAGMFFVLRNRGSATEYCDLNEHMQMKRQRKWLQKYNFDLSRYHFLEQKIERIDKELKFYESQLID